MYSLDQELAFATQKVREQRAVIATLQSELAAAKQSRDREIMAYDRLNNTFLDLKLDLAAAKERESDLHRLLRAQSGLIEEQRQEIARALVCVGYVNHWHMQQLTSGIKDDCYPAVRPDKDDVYFIPVYIDQPQHESTHKGEEG